MIYKSLTPLPHDSWSSARLHDLNESVFEFILHELCHQIEIGTIFYNIFYMVFYCTVGPWPERGVIKSSKWIGFSQSMACRLLR